MNNYFTAFLAGILLLAASCEEKPMQMGRDMLPSDDFVSIKSEVLNVKTWTMYSDSVRSDHPSASYLGQLYDPYFGTTTASFVTQIRLGSTWNFKIFTIDSIKLYLRILSASGATGQTHFLRLSEIDKQLYADTDSAYYSGGPVPLTGFSVTNIQLPELKADTVIALDIPIELGNKILADTSKLFYDPAGIKPDFPSYFKGLFFEMISPGDPLMVSLSLAPPTTTGTYSNFFVLYGRNEVDEQRQFYFILDALNRNASYNRYVHTFSDAQPEKKIPHINDTTFLDTLSYVQTMNGVFTRMVIPGLKAIKNDPAMKGIAVNKARLVMPIVYDGNIYTAKTIPSQLFLRYVTSTGEKFIVPDYKISSSFFDGKPDTANGVYNLNIATFMQGYLEDKTGKLKPELELFMSPVTPNNVILKANSSHFPVKLEFTYTKF